MSKSIPSRVVIVEDDPAISAVVKYYLNKEGYRATSIPGHADSTDVIRKLRPDLLILDWMLPDVSGFDILLAIREDPELQNLPIIMVSSRDEEFDKINVLYNGADDYIVKPFTPVELNARIHAIFRRIRPAFTGQTFTFDDIQMDLASYEVRRNGALLKLAPIEFQILQMLMENPGRVFSRQALISRIWGPDVEVGVRTVDVHMTRLRSVLMSQSTRPKVDVIKTVRMMGYVLRLDDHEKELKPIKSAKKSTKKSVSAVQSSKSKVA